MGPRRTPRAVAAPGPGIIGGDLAVLAVAVLAVSTSGPLIAATSVGAPALAIAFWRNALGAAATAAVVLPRRHIRAELAGLSARELRLIVLAGVLLAAHFATWMPSLGYTSVASGTALVCVQPVWTALGTRLTGGAVSRATWTGIAISLAAVLLLTGADFSVSGRALVGDLLAIIGGVLAAAYTAAGESVRRTVSTGVYTTLCYSTCAVVLLLCCLVAGLRLGGYDGGTWTKIVALTIGAQLLGHTLFNRVVGRVGATVVSTAVLVEVPGAALIAMVFLDQTPPATVVPAGLLLIAGVAVVVRAEGRRAALPVD
jgi:drug/metabolite transporter (DMT)-like permease